jgi:hypothetical protein
MPNGRCRLHGGRSTGPRTKAGRQRIGAARTTHGWWTEEGRAFRHAIAVLRAQARMLRCIHDRARRQRREIGADR